MHRKRILFVLSILTSSFLFLAVSGSGPAFGQAKQPKDVTLLKGAPIGGVKFQHKLHSETYTAKKCETCHHASKPEKASTAPQQACFECHTTPAKAPMKTNRQAAFHNPLGKAGTCIDCHLAENAKGKKAPVGPKCMDCHKKENI
jgi:hypothetical protein